MILDSSFLIDIEWEHEGALAKAREIEAAELPRPVPLVVVSELYISIGKGTRTEENQQAVDRVLRALPIAELSVSIAKRAGIVEGELQAEDESDEGIGLVEALIASIALEYDEPIVTGDPDDFRRVEGVRVETY